MPLQGQADAGEAYAFVAVPDVDPVDDYAVRATWLEDAGRAPVESRPFSIVPPIPLRNATAPDHWLLLE